MAQRKSKPKAAPRSEPRAAAKPSEPRAAAKPAAIERNLAALASRLSDGIRVKRGGILLRCTDSGEEYYVQGSGNDARVTSGAAGDSTPVLVRIAGPTSVLAAVMSGQKEASRAFAAGGLKVSGDVAYLESLLKDLSLLQCE